MILDITFHQFIDNILTMADKVYYLITHSIIPFMINNYFFRLMLILILLSFLVVLAFNLLDISTSGIFNYSDDYAPRHGPRHSSGYLDSVPEVEYDNPNTLEFMDDDAYTNPYKVGGRVDRKYRW